MPKVIEDFFPHSLHKIRCFPRAFPFRSVFNEEQCGHRMVFFHSDIC